MGTLAQKLFPPEELRERVTIRVNPDKMQIYPRFKELVTRQLGSDVCFVTTSLWEAFLNAMDQVPPPSEKAIEMKFMRQNVQINIGCNITYQPKKARRSPATPSVSMKPIIEIRKGHFLPLLLEEWSTMNARSKAFWTERLIEAGIMPKPRKRRKRAPSVSTGKRKRKRSRAAKLMGNCMTKVTGALRRLFRRKK